jgi:malonate transporter and related proteins
MYGIGFVVSRVAFRSSTSVAALAALAASTPDIPSMGPAVLGDLLGSASAVPIGLGSLIINLTVIPVTIVLLSMGSPHDQAHNSAAQHSADSPYRHSVLIPTLVQTIQQPIVWAPLVAFVMVLLGIHIPHLVIHSLSLLGSAGGGIALFSSGIILASNPIRISAPVLTMATLKNIVQPALLLVSLMGLSETRIAHELVLTTAIPMGPIVIMLATQYGLAQTGAASAVFISMVSSVVTMSALIGLT